jgi:hypothetical protein
MAAMIARNDAYIGAAAWIRPMRPHVRAAVEGTSRAWSSGPSVDLLIVVAHAVIGVVMSVIRVVRIPSVVIVAADNEGHVDADAE